MKYLEPLVKTNIKPNLLRNSKEQQDQFMIEESVIPGTSSEGNILTSSEQKHRASIPNQISIPSHTSYNASPRLLNAPA